MRGGGGGGGGESEGVERGMKRRYSTRQKYVLTIVPQTKW